MVVKFYSLTFGPNDPCGPGKPITPTLPGAPGLPGKPNSPSSPWSPWNKEKYVTIIPEMRDQVMNQRSGHEFILVFLCFHLFLGSHLCQERPPVLLDPLCLSARATQQHPDKRKYRENWAFSKLLKKKTFLVLILI